MKLISVGILLLINLFCVNCSNSNLETINAIVPPVSEPIVTPPSDDDMLAKQQCDLPVVQIEHSAGYSLQPQTMVFLNPTEYPKAICNDGSPAMYTIRKGFGVSKSRWMVYLEGGGACANNPICTARAKGFQNLLTSKLFSDGGKKFTLKDGIQSPDPSVNPDFYDMNTVMIHYCSSDAWTGTRLASNPNINDIPNGWHFMGHEIVKAVISDLLKKQGMDSATELILAGGSAGGVGTFNNSSAVKSYIPTSIRYVALPNAGFISQVAMFDPTEPDGISKASGDPFAAYNTEAYAMWNPIGDLKCEEHSQGVTDSIQCGMGESITAKTSAYVIPTFIGQSLNDFVQLDNEGLDIEKVQPEPQATLYKNYFAEKMRQKLRTTGDVITVFSGMVTDHVIIQSEHSKDPYTFTKPDGSSETLSMLQAVGEWYREPCTAIKRIQ